MSLASEFKQFVMRGNVVDLAVGVIVGAAFGKIVSSLVADVVMPPLGMLIGGVNFTDLKILLKQAEIDAVGKIISPAVTLNIGNFLQTIFDFLIISLAIFAVVKIVNRLQAKKVEEPVVVPTLSTSEILLTEIRDSLKNR